ncbi:MAG: polysaccharide deacetylase family protein, partial [Anaerotignum sp.]|nr:polysaccharide deacetylase family protein [Anaerotignum sp.]
MGRRKLVVFAVIFSLFSLSSVCTAEAKEAVKQPQYVKIVQEAKNPEKLKGEYIPVLMYHDFAKGDVESGDGMVATIEQLEEHIRYFQAEGYRIIPLEQLDTLLKRAEHNHSVNGKGFGFGQKYLCITMDDGYRSNYELAYPLFKKYQAPAAVFAVTDFVTEQYGVQKFTWEQAKEMDDAGWLKVYSHSADHVPVEAGQEETFLTCMQKSESTLAEYLEKDRVKAMAYPNGQYTAVSQRMLQKDGYVMQFT